ncbi:MAG: flagellar hook-basal body complex protein FliE [Candidatus Tectimicrobiota bacterium]
MDLTRIESSPALQPGRLPLAPESRPGPAPFAQVLQQTLDQVNSLQHEADAAVRAFALGQAPSVHDTIIAMEKADISLRLTTRVRNKVVEAYQDVMRMQV